MKVRFALWLGLVAACLLVVGGTRFTADMSAFLPASPTAAQQLLVDQLRHGPVARVLLLAIGGPVQTAPQRAQLSQALTRELRGARGFTAVTNGTQLPGDGEQELLFRYRYLLGDAVEAGRFTAAGLRGAIGQSLQDLASPLGFSLKDLLPRDPTGEMLRLIDQLEPAEAPASSQGVWSSADGTRALILVQLQEDGTELDAQEAALATIHRAFEQAREAQGSSATLEVTGAARFAVESRHRIRSDVERLSLIGAVLILLMLGFIYRSPRLLLLGVLPVASGALASIAAVSLVFGQVHGITLGFGIALIGEAIDYAIYIFIQGNRARLWRTIRLGVLTSLIGFSTLLWSGFPGLSQLGLFAVTGILTAALVTAGLLGPMFTRAAVPVPAPLVRALAGLLARVRRLRWLPALAAVGALAVLLALSSRQPLWEPSLEALSPVSEASKNLDTQLRSELKAPDMRYVVAVVSATADESLAGAAAAAGLLQPLVRDGVLAGFESPSRLLPDQATQLRRRNALPPPEQLRTLVDDATAGTPLRAGKLQPFLDDIERSRKLEPLRVDQVRGTAIGVGLDSMMVSGPQRTTAILPLRAPDTAQSLGTLDASAVRAALAAYAGPGAIHLIDIKTESDSLYAGYLKEAIVLASAGLALIVLVIALALRFDGRRLYRVVLPICASLACIVAGLAAAGIGLTILHLVGLLLTAAVGSNYTLFFIDNDDDDPKLLASLALANATTLIGFGILGFASVPVLNAIGLTVGPGALLCLAFAAMLSRRSDAITAPPVPLRTASAWSPNLPMRLSFWLHGIVAVGVAAIAAHAWSAGGLTATTAALLWLAAAAVVVDHLVLTAAGLCPRCSLLGPNLTRLPAPARDRGEIAITLDDGPDPLVTPLVLDLLKEAGATASFFLIARNAEQHPALVARMVAEGHSVENHTWAHSHRFAFSGPSRFRREILRAQQSLARLAGEAPRFFRAPAGMRNPLLEPVLSSLGLPLTSWTRRGFDTVNGDPAKVLERLVGKDAERLAAGDILLLHDGHAAAGPDGRPVILSVLPQLLAACRRRRLRPVSLRQAMPAAADRHPTPPAAASYSHCSTA